MAFYDPDRFMKIPSPLLYNALSSSGKVGKTGKAAMEAELSIQAGKAALVYPGEKPSP